ncbi:MAG TPA: LysR substrate-binding domain-containing protein [Vineibacter sp.]|nr:LysR substrate-binding domain-containing protein [Vineibacter sp.]
MKQLPPLTELRAFEAAARHLSFKAAAAELGVTPTAISHQIRLLEQHCGQPLFRRRPRPLTLTWAGEQLFPVIRDGFDSFADALAAVRAGSASGRLRVTATNAFSARLLVPQLPLWRKLHPRLRLDIIGTDAVLNLKSGEADVAVRYARQAPVDAVWTELVRDTFHVVASRSLVGRPSRMMTPFEIAKFPLIDCEWPPTDAGAPTWQRWEAAARERHGAMPSLANSVSLSFREELHAIEAVISGQGICICSDILIHRELANGTVLRVSDICLPGYSFYVVNRPDHPKKASIKAFTNWIHATLLSEESRLVDTARRARSPRH